MMMDPFAPETFAARAALTEDQVSEEADRLDALFLSLLTPVQRRQYKRDGEVAVTVPTGTWWIDAGGQLYDEDGHPEEHARCISPSEFPYMWAWTHAAYRVYHALSRIALFLHLHADAEWVKENAGL